MRDKDMQYKVGDSIQFKTWNELTSEFGEPDSNGIINTKQGFTEDMKFLCGTKNFITQIESNYFITCLGVGRNYCITDDVIKPWNMEDDHRHFPESVLALDWLVWFALQRNSFISDLMPNIHEIYKTLENKDLLAKGMD